MRLSWLFLLILGILACAGTPLLETPRFACPTSVPPTIAVSTVIPVGFPTAIPSPIALSPTPYVIEYPQYFYLADAIVIGNPSSALRVQLRLQNVVVTPLHQEEQVVSWELEVRNLGTAEYEIFPALQNYMSEIRTAYGIEAGAWGATQAAGDLMGIPVHNEVYHLQAQQRRIFVLAALTPRADVRRFSFQLDPSQSNGQVMNWRNELNPYCP